MRLTRALLAVLLMCFGISGGLTCSSAFADGDPASDVLAYEPIFDPPDSGMSARQYLELKALVRYVNGHGYKLKVALIGSAADLGSASFYWEDASGYASRYLGIELKYLFHGTLLVVMPQTDGLYDPVAPDKIPQGDKKAMSGLAPAGAHLGAGAIQIVRRLAADNGITLPHMFALTGERVKPAPESALPLVGFVAGLVAIIGAWAVSLVVRPASLPMLRR